MNLYLERNCPLRRNRNYKKTLEKLLTNSRSKRIDQRNGSGSNVGLGTAMMRLSEPAPRLFRKATGTEHTACCLRYSRRKVA